MRYFKKLIGEKVYLSPINPDDYEIYTKWMNDPNVTKYLSNHNSFVCLASEKSFLEKACNEEFILAIVKSDDDTLIGNIGLEDINYKNGTGTLGIFLGEEESRGKGYGSEAIKLLTNFAFQELHLHNINLDVHDDNERAIKTYQKCGFKEYGRRHESIFQGGKYKDLIQMELINKD